MNDPAPQLLQLARFYLRHNDGCKVSGVVHNLNNYIHFLKMQLELCTQKLDLGDISSLERIKKYIERQKSAIQELTELCNNLEQRSYYLQEESTLLDIDIFLDWLHQFWMHDLYYKHHISMDIRKDPGIPTTLQLPPFLLTLCLEEAFKKTVHYCRLEDYRKNCSLELHITPLEQGIFIRVFTPYVPQNGPLQELNSAEAVPDLSDLGQYLIRNLCAKAGWNFYLRPHTHNTEYGIEIKKRKTVLQIEDNDQK